MIRQFPVDWKKGARPMRKKKPEPSVSRVAEWVMVKRTQDIARLEKAYEKAFKAWLGAVQRFEVAHVGRAIAEGNLRFFARQRKRGLRELQQAAQNLENARLEWRKAWALARKPRIATGTAKR